MRSIGCDSVQTCSFVSERIQPHAMIYREFKRIGQTNRTFWNQPNSYICLRACSHKPGAVNYPGIMTAPGQALPHMKICCPGATLPWVNLIAPGQVQRHLITTNWSKILYFLHKLQQRMNFIHVTYFWCFLEDFIVKFILNIDNDHAHGYSCTGQLFRSVHMEKITSARRVTLCCTTGNPPPEVVLGQRKTHVNSYRRSTMYRGKVDNGVSELSWDHVNRPQRTSRILQNNSSGFSSYEQTQNSLSIRNHRERKTTLIKNVLPDCSKSS